MEIREMLDILCKIAENCGSVRNDTVNPQDPTSRTKYEINFAMQHGFGEGHKFQCNTCGMSYATMPPSKKCIEGEFKEEDGTISNDQPYLCDGIIEELPQSLPPDPEIVKVKITDIWDRDIEIEFQSKHPSIRVYWSLENSRFRWIALDGHQYEKTQEMIYPMGVFQNVLTRLILEGDWGKKDFKHLEPDPMGTLKDHE